MTSLRLIGALPPASWWRSAALIAIALAFLWVPPTALRAEPFSFIAVADTGYKMPEDGPLMDELIAVINAETPAFTIHLGDTKGGGDCGDEFQLSIRDQFGRYEHPVIYAPGNNEWSECWRDDLGAYDPVERLGALRRIFFATPMSLGQSPIRLVRQSDGADHRDFSENALWEHGGVVFATINVVGSANSMRARSPETLAEFYWRNEANKAWIARAFADAHSGGAKGVVIGFHSNPVRDKIFYDDGPFEGILTAIKTGAENFAGQVLMLHAHGHEFIIDRPFIEKDNDNGEIRHANLLRLQVFGWPKYKAVRVTVDTGKPAVFGFEQVYGDNWLSR